MKYVLFDDYITLQSLLKDLGIIKSGGAIKSFLADTDVFFNGERESRRGKKIRIGDSISIPSLNKTITIQEPTKEDFTKYQAEKAEKERISTLVKQMNQKTKKSKTVKTKKAVRFPGT